MQIENYFEVVTPEGIRLKGTRVGIETVLHEYIHRAQTPEQIADRFDALTLEQVYATILYHVHHRERVSAYLAAWLEHGERARAAQERDPRFQRQRERPRHARATHVTDISTTVGAPHG